MNNHPLQDTPGIRHRSTGVLRPYPASSGSRTSHPPLRGARPAAVPRSAPLPGSLPPALCGPCQKINCSAKLSFCSSARMHKNLLIMSSCRVLLFFPSLSLSLFFWFFFFFFFAYPCLRVNTRYINSTKSTASSKQITGAEFGKRFFAHLGSMYT